eukprot:7056456-Prymnesium_polylepis.2
MGGGLGSETWTQRVMANVARAAFGEGASAGPASPSLAAEGATARPAGRAPGAPGGSVPWPS